MVTRALIDEFLAQKSLALVGVSRDGTGFGNMVRKELIGKGYAIKVVHHEADSLEGQPCARHLSDVVGDVGGLVLVTPPAVTLALLQEASDAGFRRVWLQQGAESPEAVAFCDQHGMAVVHGECILMFAQPTAFPHWLHGQVNRLMGRLPQ